MTVLRIQNLAQVMSPRGLSTTRSSLSKEHSSEESQIPETEDKGKELKNDPFSEPYNQSLLSSTQESIESLATAQEADLDDEQIRALLASPRYLPVREARAERSHIYHSDREGLISSSSRSPNFIGTGRPVAWLSHTKRLGQDEFSGREQADDVSRGNEPISSDSLTQRMLQNLFLKEIETTCLLKRDLN